MPDILDKQDAKTKTVTKAPKPTIIPARPGAQPVTDIATFFASLPVFEPEEVEALQQAIAEDRAQRRALANEREQQGQ